LTEDFIEVWSEYRIKSLMLAEFGEKGSDPDQIKHLIIDP